MARSINNQYCRFNLGKIKGVSEPKCFSESISKSPKILVSLPQIHGLRPVRFYSQSKLKPLNFKLYAYD
jgi:hypothetical protein